MLNVLFQKFYVVSPNLKYHGTANHVIPEQQLYIEDEFV